MHKGFVGLRAKRVGAVHGGAQNPTSRLQRVAEDPVSFFGIETL